MAEWIEESFGREDCSRIHPWGMEPHITVRESTAAERVECGKIWATGATMRAKDYVICRYTEPTQLLGAFGLVDGADTREEIVFWAERMASKNGFHFIRPEGWEDVVGELPERDE